MAATSNPFGPFRDLLLAPLMPLQATQHIRRFNETIENGGCKYGCEYGRCADSRLPWDTDGEYGGWSGSSYFETTEDPQNIPVVFVHGNQRDACDWGKPAEYFREQGYSPSSLWAITFKQGTPTHDQMATQLESFISRVREHTGFDEVVVVGHSLGVTGLRKWMLEHERHEWVDTFIGLAGANHGVDFATMICMMGLDNGPYRMSEFLRSDYDTKDDHPLAELNETETPGDVDYYTLRGKRDELFWGNRKSPVLEGAEENLVINQDHDGVRESDEALELIFRWSALQS